MHGMRKRSICLSLLMISGACLSGCLRQKVLVAVEQDGSGEIAVTRIMPPVTVAMILEQVAHMPAQARHGTATEDPLFNTAALRAEARLYGPGVSFKNARKIDHAGHRGAVAVYSFLDVRDVFFNAGLKDGGMFAFAQFMHGESFDMMPDQGIPSEAITFQLTTGTTSRLTIVLPETFRDLETKQEKLPENIRRKLGLIKDESGTNAADSTDGEVPDEHVRAAMDEAMSMYRNMSSILDVQVNGELISSTAKHPPDKPTGRQTVFALDFAAMDRSGRLGEVMMQMAGMMDPFGGSSNPFTVFYGQEGFVIESAPEIVIEFKSR